MGGSVPSWVASRMDSSRVFVESSGEVRAERAPSLPVPAGVRGIGVDTVLPIRPSQHFHKLNIFLVFFQRRKQASLQGLPLARSRTMSTDRSRAEFSET